MELDKLYLDDCFEGMKDIPDHSIDLVVTDPPYLHIKGHGRNLKTGKAYVNGHSAFAQSDLYDNDGEMMGQMSDFGKEEIDKVLQEFVRVLKKKNMYIFCNETQVPYYCQWATDHDLMFSILVWQKPLSIINRNRFSQNIEFIIRIYDYGTALNRIENENIFYNRVKDISPIYKKMHPCEKPVSLVEQFILLSSNEGDTILDAFAGSGTTAIAASKNKRHYICFEKSEKYYEIARNRIDKETSQLTFF